MTTRATTTSRLLEPSTLRHPAALALYEKPAVAPSEGVVICLHGSLDKARSFARVARRLPTFDVFAYDRRGYQGSRSLGASDKLNEHIDDLLTMIALVQDRGPVIVFGHSLGGVISIGAAVAEPTAMAAVMAYESPMRWLIDDGPDWWQPQQDAGKEAEIFFRRITSDAAWDRLSETEREDRRADGAALVADLTMVRTTIPFHATQLALLATPVVVAVGGASDHPRYKNSAEVIVDAAPVSMSAVLDGAAHGAHLSHPDGVAALIADVARNYGRTRRIEG